MSRCLRVMSLLSGEERPDAAWRVCVSMSFSFNSFVGVQMRVVICDSGIAGSCITDASNTTELPEDALSFELLGVASVSGCFSLSMSAGKKSTYVFATVAIWQNMYGKTRNLDPAYDAHVGPDGKVAPVPGSCLSDGRAQVRTRDREPANQV